MRLDRLNIDNLKYVALAGVLAAAWPNVGFAQEMSATVASVVEGMKDLPTVVSGASYLIGGLMVIGGANKLKMHAEKPQEIPLTHGVVRIAVGGVVAGLSPFLAWVNKSMSIGNGQTTFKKLQKISMIFDGVVVC